jgi:hypothetical protein
MVPAIPIFFFFFASLGKKGNVDGGDENGEHLRRGFYKQSLYTVISTPPNKIPSRESCLAGGHAA